MMDKMEVRISAVSQKLISLLKIVFAVMKAAKVTAVCVCVCVCVCVEIMFFLPGDKWTFKDVVW